MITPVKERIIRNLVKSIRIYVDNGWNVTAEYFQFLWKCAEFVEMEPFTLEDIVHLNPEERAYELIASQV